MGTLKTLSKLILGLIISGLLIAALRLARQPSVTDAGLIFIIIVVGLVFFKIKFLDE